MGTDFTAAAGHSEVCAPLISHEAGGRRQSAAAEKRRKQLLETGIYSSSSLVTGTPPPDEQSVIRRGYTIWRDPKRSPADLAATKHGTFTGPGSSVCPQQPQHNTQHFPLPPPPQAPREKSPVSSPAQSHF
ncbi:unnamed protein product [Pleuronectes platessa]|uniref:Uncharacterized protein n=1 Tax=Pleuronectes platessa TaxID=8262 RepID=A0A9N7TTJ7_PLEPL|nr:unnamed protein product [Pleuronectes platessa]